MIIFETCHQKLFNHIINNFLQIEVFNGIIEIGDMIEIFMPDYLRREQYHKCVSVFEDLYNWTSDNFYHAMTAFHEMALYHFVDYMSDLQKDMEDFNELYFDKECKALIEEASQIDYEADCEISVGECSHYYYDVFSYPDSLFFDTDFLMIADLVNYHEIGNTQLEECLGINIDYYFEILPLDIQKRYPSKHMTLTGELSEFLEYIEYQIKNGNLYKLFWENGKPVGEARLQLILENIMDAYFHGMGIDVNREVLLGCGKVDFKLYKNQHEDEKVLIEIKKASSKYLKKGFEKQLTQYMLSAKYKNSFYLIACFTDDEYQKTENFIDNHIYTDSVQLYINILILDLRKRKSASL